MLTSLFFALMAETVQPSYAAFSFIFPQNIVVEANASRTTVGAKKTVKKTESLEPVIRATSVFSVDLTNETPLLVRNIFERRPIASIGKLVTAMVILDAHALDETVTVTEHAANQEPTRMNLQAGEKITIENLLTGLLVGSANDAAIALAEYDAGSESAFVAKMNAKILSLGLHNTHFSNPPGFDEPANYSTAFDTMVFARAALQYRFIKKVVAVKKIAVTSANEKITHELESTNELLENPHFDVIGLKTGRTPAAGPSFVSIARGPKGHEIQTVILDSPDRFKETKIILDWIFRNFDFY